MTNFSITEGDADSDTGMDLGGRQEGRREVQKFVHGIRNREVMGGPANAKADETCDKRREQTVLLDLSEGERLSRL
eukprot:6184574-Pleurochrysis_carterae.AAC.7